MAAETKLEAARRTGSLKNVIGALREEARTETASAGTPAREQVGLEDSAIRMAATASAAGTKDAERRTIFRDLRPGVTVTAQGVAKTLLTREQKIARVKAWASAMTEEQRTEYMIGEKYGALSENAQTVIAEAFDELDSRAEEDALGVANYDLNGELADVDTLVGDDEEDDPIDASELGENDYTAIFEEAGWEAEQTP